MTGVTAFITPLTGTGVLPHDTDTARLADSCRVPAGPKLAHRRR